MLEAKYKMLWQPTNKFCSHMLHFDYTFDTFHLYVFSIKCHMEVFEMIFTENKSLIYKNNEHILQSQ